MSEIYDKLNQAALDLSKTSKISQKLHDQAMSIPVDDRTPRINQGTSELLTLMMEADIVQSELSFMIKYKKVKGSNEPINLSNAQSGQHNAASFLTQLVEASKGMKAFLPSSKSA